MEFPTSLNAFIFIILLIVPGAVLKRFYFQGEFTKEYTAGIFADRLFSSIFLGLFVQTITFLIIGMFFGFESVNETLPKLYSATSDQKFNEITSGNLWAGAGYLFANLLVAAFLGGATHKFVRIQKYDLSFRLLRFDNEWYYIFRGDIKTTEDDDSADKEVIETYINIVMDVEEEGSKKMVRGFLQNYSISSKTGDLDAIFLTDASKYSPRQEQYVPIPGACFVVPYKNVVDMNVSYVYKESAIEEVKHKFYNTFNHLSNLGILLSICYPWLLNGDGAMRFSLSVLSFVTYLVWLMVIVSVTKITGKIILKQADLQLYILTGIVLTIATGVVCYIMINMQ